MPKINKGGFLDSASKETTYKNWTAALADTISSELIQFDNPPYEVGLWTLIIGTTDSGGGTPTITPTLKYWITGSTYEATGHSLSDLGGNSTFTSGGQFICRLNLESWWAFNNGFKIDLTRDANSALVIDFMEVIAI